jgi:hypothetical protein
MSGVDDLCAALADEISRRQLAEMRLAHYERKLAEAHKTIKALTQLAASCPGVSEVGVIAHAALLGTLAADDDPPRIDAAATVVG